MTETYLIFGVSINARLQNAPEVQRVFSEFGCHIRSRIGLHRIYDGSCSPNGLILLEMWGDENACREMKRRLEAFDGVEVQEMRFEHPLETCKTTGICPRAGSRA